MERFPQFKEILTNAGFHTKVVAMQPDLVRDVRATLFLLWGGVAFVLLIGCVNLTNLMLVRSSGRLKELATRHALGAGRCRLARQLLTETVLLTIAGAALGLAAAYWALDLLVAGPLADLPRAAEIGLDGQIVAFTIALALAVGVAISLIPIAGMHPHEPEPGDPRGRTIWHGRPRRPPRATGPRREPGGVRVHAARSPRGCCSRASSACCA